jgi:hypothetical protein
MGFKTGSTKFGEFDFLEELDKLCKCPTYAHVFEQYGLPSLAVYRSKQAGLTYRGHAKTGLHHIHLTVGPVCKIGHAWSLIAHELAHIICHREGFDRILPQGRTNYHHAKFDEVLSVLVSECYGVDLPVGDRQGRYDYSWRLARHLSSGVLENGSTFLCQLEEVPERKNQQHQPNELWGWNMTNPDYAEVKLRSNQSRIVGYILPYCDHFPLEIPRVTLNGDFLRIPLRQDSVTMFCGTLESYWYSRGGKVESALAQRIRKMWSYVKATAKKAAGESE